MELLPKSKLPHTETTIFTVMSALADEYQALNLSQGFPDFDPPADLLDRVSFYSVSYTHLTLPTSRAV